MDVYVENEVLPSAIEAMQESQETAEEKSLAPSSNPECKTQEKGDAGCSGADPAATDPSTAGKNPVSYTHLTLPTNREV